MLETKSAFFFRAVVFLAISLISSLPASASLTFDIFGLDGATRGIIQFETAVGNRLSDGVVQFEYTGEVISFTLDDLTPLVSWEIGDDWNLISFELQAGNSEFDGSDNGRNTTLLLRGQGGSLVTVSDTSDFFEIGIRTGMTNVNTSVNLFPVEETTPNTGTSVPEPPFLTLLAVGLIGYSTMRSRLHQKFHLIPHHTNTASA